MILLVLGRTALCSFQVFSFKSGITLDKKLKFSITKLATKVKFNAFLKHIMQKRYRQSEIIHE